MKVLITSDLHLTDREQDEYRWGFLQWLARQTSTNAVDFVAILGDLTDRKDRHSAVLVNRVVDELLRVADAAPVHVLMGNHDYDVDSAAPFFRFLSYIPGLHYHSMPRFITFKKNVVALLPHTRDDFFKTYRRHMRLVRQPRLVLMHQTLSGAIAETGFMLSGMDPKKVSKLARGATVISGDVHVPQRVGPVTYVGSPYHVHFGDSFDPRVILWHNGKVTSVRRHASPRLLRQTVDSLDEIDAKKGDHIKLTIRAHPREWRRMRAEAERYCEERGYELRDCSVVRKRVRLVTAESEQLEGDDRQQWIRRVAERNKVTEDVLEAALSLLK